MDLHINDIGDKFIDEWCRTVRRTKIAPKKKMERMSRRHKELILSWFKAKGRLSSGIVEGLNNKARVTVRKSYDLEIQTFKESR